MNISDRFLDIVSFETAGNARKDVMLSARMCILDYIGCVFAGNRIFKERERTFIERISKQGGVCHAIGILDGMSMHNAAFINGMSAHATELDDGHRFGMLHLGGSILSALIPVAEVEKISSDDLLAGTVAGYETAIRVAMAMQPSHKMRGYHTSGTCGTVGAAMAIAVAMHFTRPQMKSALSAAAASASGLLEMQEDGSEMKPYNLAQAAVCGITAAYAGLAGFVGPDDPLAGKRGMLNVLSDAPDFEKLLAPMDRYCIETIYRKHYAACRHCHPAIEAALSVFREHNLHKEDIASIRVETYRLAVGGHDHKDIKGIASAKLSIPFSVALALCKGDASLGEYTMENINDPAVLSLMDKVEVSINDTLTSWSPEKRAAIVTLNTTSGDSYECEIDYPRGEPENPMTRKEVEEKFISLAVSSGASLARCEYIISMMDSAHFDVPEFFMKLR